MRARNRQGAIERCRPRQSPCRRRSAPRLAGAVLALHLAPPPARSDPVIVGAAAAIDAPAAVVEIGAVALAIRPPAAIGHLVDAVASAFGPCVGSAGAACAADEARPAAIAPARMKPFRLRDMRSLHVDHVLGGQRAPMPGGCSARPPSLPPVRATRSRALDYSASRAIRLRAHVTLDRSRAAPRRHRNLRIPANSPTWARRPQKKAIQSRATSLGFGTRKAGRAQTQPRPELHQLASTAAAVQAR